MIMRLSGILQGRRVNKPERHRGLRHVALYCDDLSRSESFYVDLLGMAVEWRPDANNVYLSSGVDNLALHQAPAHLDCGADQRLDHIGFILEKQSHVDDWFDWLQAHGVTMKTEPKTHRDGARSFYCLDPDGNTVQMIYHPPISGIAF